MKLFQRLLVAPAALGLMAPLSANATEVNLNEISNYSDVESIELANSFDDNSSNQSPLLAGGEGLVDSSDSFDGSFSETTTASFGVTMYAGVTKDDDTGANDFDDNLTTGYDFSIGLNTSFTGEDSLDVAIIGGDSDQDGIGEFGGDSTTDEALTMDGIAYTFPLGDSITVMVGDGQDASSLFTTACVYGTPSDTLDDCGVKNANVENGGVMAGAAYDFGNGLTAAIGYAGDENDVANEEGKDAYGFNVAYTGDSYGVAFTYGALEDGVARDNMGTDFAYALTAYWTPESDGLPSISVGYEYGEDDSEVAASDEYTNVFAGLQWSEVGPGSFGVGIGSKTNTIEDTDAQYQTEAFYEYPVNDGMTITGLVYVKDVSTAGTDDTTGVMVKTSFSF